MRDESVRLLATLTEADGAPGHEGEVRRIFRARLSRIGPVATDRLGSVYCTKPGAAQSPRILLDSHLDEVGFLVQRVTATGYVKFLPLGSWWGHSLLAQRVRILTSRGKVPGVVASSPPHLLPPAARDRVMDIAEMFIDIGAGSREQATDEFGVVPGCPIVPESPFREMQDPNVLCAKAFDNRVGVALVIETLERLAAHPNTVVGAASAQEELGFRGARTLAALVSPDVAIVVEGPYADDGPAADRQAMQCRLGGGVHIRLFDPTMIANPQLGELAIETARSHGIPHQVAVWAAGGTNAGAIHQAGAGVPTIVLGVPVRYIHNHVSLIRIEDYRAALELLIRLIPRLDAATVRGLSEEAA